MLLILCCLCFIQAKVVASGFDEILSTVCNESFCEAIYDNPSLDTIRSKKQKEFSRLLQEVNGKHLKIATFSNFPMSWTEKDDNGTLTLYGVAFTLLDILRERFNFTFEIVAPDKNYLSGGAKPEDSLIGLLNNSNPIGTYIMHVSQLADMAAAFIPILVKFQNYVDFSIGLDEGMWMMMLRRPKESAAGSGLLAPFDNRVWYLILAAVLSYGPCITLLTRIRSKLVRDNEDHISLSPSFWFVYGAFIKQGTTLTPEANTTRVLFATWWMFIILLSAFYTANLTAFLTLSKFTLDIETPEDLYKKNYRWVTSQGSAVEFVVKNGDMDFGYLYQMVINGRAEFRSFHSDSSFLSLVSGGSVLIRESTAIDYLMYGDYLTKAREGVKEEDRCTYVLAPNSFMVLPRGFAYPKNSKLKNLFDPVLSDLFQSGIIPFLEHKDLPSTKICPLDLQSKDRRLRNSDLMMTYMIMVTGLAAACAVFIVEILIRRYVRVKITQQQLAVKKKKKSVKRIRFNDHSEPPPYDSLFGKNSRYKFAENAKKKIINGREYYVVDTVSGDTRLIPMRTPSAFLYR